MRFATVALPDTRGRLDALAWLAGCGLVLCVIRIGFLSGDGVAQSATYAAGTWHLNPNHLLYEPLGAWWQSTLTRVGVPRSGPDQLKWLSILAGAVTLALVRWGLAPWLAADRTAANLATAWVALSSTFARLWISDEAEMVQMPWLVCLAIAVWAYIAKPGWRAAAMIGVWGGVATLFYISDSLIVIFAVAALAGCHWANRERRQAGQLLGSVGLAGAVTAGAAFVLAWYGTGRTHGFLTWLASYAGGESSTRMAAIYGFHGSLRSLPLAVARAAYGAASSVVDLGPLVGQVRDGATPSVSAILSALVFAIGTVVMALALRGLTQAGRERHDWRALAVVLGWTAGVLGFGVYWNASDDQFYFQLAIPMGVLIAAHRRDNTKRGTVWLTMTAAVLVWNLADVTSRFVLYPRAERIRMLDSGLAGAGLVVYPGNDEIGQLEPFITSVPPRRFLSIAGLADQHPPQEGLSLLRQWIEETLAAGASVDVVAIYDAPQRRQPWKALRELGYDYGTVLQLLSSFPVESSSRWMGPFSIRAIASMPRAAGKPR